MTADILLSRLERVRRSGQNRWRAVCPSCGGKNATKLSVCEADDGRVLVYCFSGCSVDSICGSVGVTLDQLFPPKVADDQRRPAVRKPWPARDVIAALKHEAMVGAVLLLDIGNGKVLAKSDRARAKVAAERLGSLMAELERT